MQVGQQAVAAQRLAGRHQGGVEVVAQRAQSRAHVEHERRLAVDLDQHAGGVAAVATLLVGRARARAPDAEVGDSHRLSRLAAAAAVRSGATLPPVDQTPPAAAGIRTVTARGTGVRLPEDGPDDGPLALCLHGFPDTAHTWRHLLPRAGRRRLPRRGPVPAGLRADGRAGRRALRHGHTGPRRLCALHEALGGDGGPSSSATTGARSSPTRRRPRARPLAPGRDHGRAAAGVDGVRLLRLRPAPAQLVRLLLPDARWPSSPSGWTTMAFIDRLWADWSPGYDGSWDAARVKESLGDRGAAVGRHRLLPGHVRPAAGRSGRGRRGGRRSVHRPPTHAVPPRRGRRLHGARDHRAGHRPPRRRARSSRSSRARATSSTSSGPTRSTTTSCAFLGSR